MKPVSIIIPAYDCEDYIRETVASALSQPQDLVEIIAIDDGSRDGTLAALQSFGDQIRVVTQSNSGVSAARNHGLDYANGRYCLFLDADDLLPEGAIQSLYECAEAHPESVVYGNFETIDSHGNILKSHEVEECPPQVPHGARFVFYSTPFPPGAVLVPRDLVERVGRFDTRFSTCADRHFWIRCGALAAFRHCHSLVFQYRKHDAAMSNDVLKNAVESVEVQEAALIWCQENEVKIWDTPLDYDGLLAKRINRAFCSREWESVNGLLSVARYRNASHKTIARVRRLSRFPHWIYKFQDYFVKNPLNSDSKKLLN